MILVCPCSVSYDRPLAKPVLDMATPELSMFRMCPRDNGLSALFLQQLILLDCPQVQPFQWNNVAPGGCSVVAGSSCPMMCLRAYQYGAQQYRRVEQQHVNAPYSCLCR